LGLTALGAFAGHRLLIMAHICCCGQGYSAYLQSSGCTHLASGRQSSQHPVLGPGVCAFHSKRTPPDAHRHRVQACICILHMHQEGACGWSCVKDFVQAIVEVHNAAAALHLPFCCYNTYLPNTIKTRWPTAAQKTIRSVQTVHHGFDELMR